MLLIALGVYMLYAADVRRRVRAGGQIVNGNFMCAIRGPILMITLGVLLAIDQMGTLSFGRTWPMLLIVFGLFKLAERGMSRQRMRRTSVVAPLLLIGIGALFLARNLYPGLPLLDYLAKYWPFLLILWGVLRLAEVLFWSATDKPLPRAGVSGGEWVLVVFLCIFGASVHAVRGFAHVVAAQRTIGGLDMFGESYEYPIAGAKAGSKTPHVVIESFRGNARIIGVDADTVKVTGHRTIRSLDQSGADGANQDSRSKSPATPTSDHPQQSGSPVGQQRADRR